MNALIVDEALDIASKVTEGVTAGGTKSIIFAILIASSASLWVIRQISKMIVNHFQTQLDARDKEIVRLNAMVAEKDRIIDERFDLFKDLTQSYVGIAKDVANSVKIFEVGFTELRTRLDVRSGR